MPNSPEYNHPLLDALEAEDFARFATEPITRREVFTLGFALGAAIGFTGFFALEKTNPFLNEFLDLKNVRSSAETARMLLSFREAKNTWWISMCDSLARHHADNQMRFYTDVHPFSNVLTGDITQLFGLKDTNKINIYTKDPSQPQPSDAEIIENLYGFVTNHEVGGINIAQNGVPIQEVPHQLQLLNNGGVFEKASNIVIFESGGGNDATHLFVDPKFTKAAESIAQGKFTPDKIPQLAYVFNLVEEQMEPVAEQQYQNLVKKKEINDVYKNIRGVVVYGNVNLGGAKGVATPNFLGKNAGYQVLKPKNAVVPLLASIYSLVLQNKKKESINQFIQDFPDAGFDILFLDLYSTLGNGIYPGTKTGKYKGERTFLYEHPTLLGYAILQQIMKQRILIENDSLASLENYARKRGLAIDQW